MDVLLTGACGTVGTAVSDHLDHEFSLLDKQETDDIDYVADVTDYDAIRPAFDGVEAVVHLAEYPATDASEATMFDNMRGMANVLRAAREAGVEQVVCVVPTVVTDGEVLVGAEGEVDDEDACRGRPRLDAHVVFGVKRGVTGKAGERSFHSSN